jgi:uncharacterized protein (DUF433 family)
MGRPESLIRLLPPYLHWHADGEIRLVGHRIGLFHFIYYYNQGFTAEMILGQFPTLELALIHKVIAFYLENQKEVDEYAAQYQADLDQLRAAGPHAPSIVELRKRHLAHRASETLNAH